MIPRSNPRPSVLKTSAQLAELLRSDPVATGLVREHLSAEEIIGMFNITESEMCQIMQIPVPADPCEDGATRD
jgi:hypothetical protein